MTRSPRHVVVVGGGLAGLRTIECLRRGGFDGRISLIGAERHPPYDRPPLSKQILAGTWEPDRAVLRTHEGLVELDVEYRFECAATSLRATTVGLVDGTEIAGDAVVVATGASPRTLPNQADGVVALRTLDHAIALRLALGKARSLVVIGAGFIGAEVACAAQQFGVQVTVLEAAAVPCERALGPQVGRLAAQLFDEADIELRCGVQVAGIPDRHTVELVDGSVVRADIVLVGVGAAPNLTWLDGAGLATTNGLACDERGRAMGTIGVWGVGDAATWWEPKAQTHVRHEHWTAAGNQATIVACDILGETPPGAAVPYVWSDQFGLKIQTLGTTGPADEVLTLHGDGLRGGQIKGTVAGYVTGGLLTGVVAFGAASKILPYRKLIMAEGDRAAALALADTAAAVTS